MKRRLLALLLTLAMLFSMTAGAFAENAEPVIVLQEAPAQEEVVQEEPVKEEPVHEEPKQEEPVKEEPVQEEPAQEEPAQEEPAQEEPEQEQPAQEEPEQEEPEQEEPEQEQPAQEEPAQEEEPEQELESIYPVYGACGEEAVWVLTEDGDLTISGKGEMDDYSGEDSQPWAVYSLEIRSVTVEKKITSIGDAAFYGEYENLKTVRLPDTLERIGDHAFEGCLKLEKIDLPEAITEIGVDAFKDCDALRRATFAGDAEAFAALTIGSGNEALTDVLEAPEAEEPATEEPAVEEPETEEPAVEEPEAEESAVDHVIGLIDAIGDVTIESESAIAAAMEAYEALTDEEKALVSNYDALEAAIAAYMSLNGVALLADEEPAEPVAADPAKVYVTINNAGHLELVGGEVTVTDIDADGVLTYDEALQAAHAAYCAGGYAASESSYGLFVTKVWGVENNGSFYFYKNGVALSEGVGAASSAVSEGDRLYVTVLKDTSNYSDIYGKFDQTSLTVLTGEAFTLTLSGDQNDIWNGGTTEIPAISGVQLGTWENGAFTAIEGAVTDENGKATITLSQSGAYTITAEGSMGTSSIMPPVCTVTVRDAVTGIALDKTEIALGEDESATITATLTPEGAAGTQITWSTSDDKIATVKDGVVTASYMGGTATITAKAGEFEASCEVTVTTTAVGSGKYGNVIWRLRDNGTLEFSAVPGSNGKMSGSISKWSLPTYIKNHNAEITAIEVKEGVTSILNYAFYTMSAVKTVSLPSTLATIGDDAFSGVKTITSFTCAEGCTLKVVDNFVLKNKGTQIYMYFGALEGVITVPDGVTMIGTTFSGTDITGIILPDSVTKIAGMNYDTWAGPFGNCKKLESITIPCNLTEASTFKGCTALKEVTFKEGVTSVATSSFSGCTALTTVNLPKSMETLPASAFDGCTALTTINCTEGGVFSMKDGVLLKNGTEIVFVLPGSAPTGELVIPEGVTVVSDYAYKNVTGITSVKFPSTLTKIGQAAFSGCTGLTGELVIPEGVTIVDREAFNDCTGITSVKLPSKLTTIGQQAFDSTGITELDLPKSVTSIGYGAFQNTKLKTLYLPDGLNITDNSVFEKCTELTEVSVGGDVTGNNAFGGCTALTTVTVREGAKSIGSRAFQGCTALTTVNLPASLTSLNAQAFYGCTALKTINFAEGSAFRCQDGVVYSSTSILIVLSFEKEELTVPDGITEIGNSAFVNQTILKKVTLPDSIVKIGNNAFNGCKNLETINLPNNLEEIGSSAFEGCAALPMVTFPASLKKIGSSAFEGCTGMKGRLYLPGTITSFGGYAFQDCSGITSVYFEDAADPANTTYGQSLLRECVNITDVRFPENLTALNNMIYHCYGLRKLVLPESVKEFSNYGDYLPDGFVYMDLKGITKFGTYTMSNMTNLKELYLSANLTDYPDTGRNCHPDIIYFRGTEEQWNAVNFASTTLENFKKYGTVIVFNYGSETGEAPKITQQPVGATYEQGLRPDPMTIEVEELEGAQYVYHWYRDGEYVASGKECEVSTAELGEHEYYCMVRCSVNGKYSEVKSDVAIITVTEFALEGEGTEENPYKLTNGEDLNRLSVLVEGGNSFEGKVFLMTEDITLPTGWKPIGCTKDGSNGVSAGANLNAFSGVFDGGNKLLTVPAGERPLFAYVNGATIRNLNIYGSQINGYGLVDCFTGVRMSGTAMIIDHVTLKSGTQTRYSGLIGARKFENSFAGCSAGYDATIRNCTIESGVVIGYTGESSEIGGFAGRMQGTIENCKNYGTVKGKNYVGGIIGTIDNAMGKCEVLNCTFDGKVIASGSNAGGIVGGGYSDSSAPNGTKVTVIGCKSSGSVSGDSNVGGILGGDVYVAQSWDNVPSSFKNNTFNGKVSGNTNVGALIGFYDSLNRIDDISGNRYAPSCGADKPVGKVYVVDTSYENPTAYGDTLYCNTKDSVSSCPSVAGCSWKTGLNRTDDPLGADAANLWYTDAAEKPALHVLINTDTNAAYGDPAQAALGEDGILRIENRTTKFRYLWLGTEDDATVTLKALRGLTSTPNPSKRTSNNVYEDTTYQVYYSSYSYKTPFVAKATVTSADGAVSADYYIIVSQGVAGKYAISASGFIADDANLYNAETGITFTEAETQQVTLTPATEMIGSGDAETIAWKWTTSDATVATVDANGKVTSIGGGTAVIKATCDTMSVSCNVTSTAAAHDKHSYVDGVCSVCGTKAPYAKKAYFTLNDQNGAIALSKDGVRLNKVEMSVPDADMDGTITINDAFLYAHEQFCADGAAGFATMSSDYGAYITKLWGVETSSVGYYVNNSVPDGLDVALKAKDSLSAFYYRDTEGYSDLYIYFESDSASVVENKAKTFTVKGDNGAIPAGAAVTVYDGEGKVVDALATAVGADGSFAITFPQTGSYTVEVSGKANYTGTAWDSATGSYVSKEFTDAPVTAAQMSVTAYPYTKATVYVTVSDKTGSFAVGKTGTEIYRLPLTVEDDPDDPDGAVTLMEVGAELHRQEYADGIDGFSVNASTGWVSKFWGDTTGSLGYNLNDVYMEGYGKTKTGTNGRPFVDRLQATAVEDGDCYNVFLYQSPYWSDAYTYFNPVNESAVVGAPKTITAYAMSWGRDVAPEGAVITVSKGGKQLDDLKTAVGADGSFTITFPEVGVYTVELRNSESEYFAPSRCVVTARLAVAGIALDKTELTLTEGGTDTLTAALSPEGAEGTPIIWTSSDDTIATVKDGVVTAVKEGKATITAKAGDMEAKCEVTVQPLPKLSALTFRNGLLATKAEFALTPAFAPEVREYTITVPDAISVSGFGVWATLAEGTEGKIEVCYYGLTNNKDNTVTVTSGKQSGAALFSCFKAKDLQTNTLTIKIGGAAAYTVQILRQPTLSALNFTAGENTYELNEALDMFVREYSALVPHDAELTVNAVPVVAEGVTLSYNGEASNVIKPVWNGRTAQLSIKLSAEGAQDGLYTVQLNQMPAKLEIKTAPKTEYAVGDTFDPTGMVLEATYADGGTETAPADQITFAPATALTQDITSVTLTYNGAQLELPITVTSALKGSGTADDPWLIETYQDFETVRDLVSKGLSFDGEYLKMVNDITLPEGWTPIGVTKDGTNNIQSGANLLPFSGNLDCSGKTLTIPEGGLPLLGYIKGAAVSNLNIYGKKIAGYGLVNNYSGVGLNVPAITIDNVTLKSGSSTLKSGLIGTYLTTNGYAGASAGFVVDIRNCTVESGVVIGYNKDQEMIGSIAGRVQGTITNCTSAATVYGTNYVGGIIGTRDNAMGTCKVTDCTFTGSVIASGEHAGGIVGGGYSNDSAPNGIKITVQNCKVSGSVTGADKVGGILGGDTFVAQAWNAYSFTGNRFTGKVSGSGSAVGGVIGYYRSLNKFDDIANNYYASNCGAKYGIGAVQYVDTNCETHETERGELYFNTETGTADCPTVKWCSWRKAHNRTDDPLGADAAKLTYTDDSTIIDVTGIALNKTEVALKTGDTEKLTATVTPDNATDKTVTWTSSDETIATVSEDGTITAKKAGAVTITAAAGGFTAACSVKITESDAIKVTISVLGDSAHGSGKVHTLKTGGLTTWVKATEYSVSNGSTVWDVLKKCLDEHNLSYSNPTGNYVSSVNGLAEFDNGKNSGWMYTLNGKYPLNGVAQQKVKDGDRIIFHYTDDYTLEDTGFSPDPDPDDNERVAEVEKKIDAIGDVTYTEASKAKIDAARAAYNDLTVSERKQVSNAQKLVDAEKKYAELQKQDDQAKADAVKKLIDEMGSDSAKIKAARKAYDDLTKDQKKLVTNYNKLTAAEYQRASSTATSSDRKSAQDTIDLIDQIGDKVSDTSGAKIDAARAAYDQLSDTQKALVTNYEQLEAAEEANEKLAGLKGFENLYRETGNLLTTLGEPGVGSVGGEWMAIGLARSGREVDAEAYLAKVAEYVAQSIDENERLHRNKSTDNSRIILALTALGMDVHDVNGHDLTAGLNDMAYIQKQGINGPIWALIALDSNAYEPAEGDVTREALIQCILDAQLTDGGWAFSGENADSDMTGMALTALAPYYVPETETEDGTKLELTEAQIAINAAIERGVECLSNLQFANGAFGTFGGNGEIVETSESTAQAVVALTALNIDPDTDERFVKNGNSALDALVSYGLTGGGFKHLMDGERDGMATEQGYYALTAYARYLMDLNRLYDMRDAFDPEAELIQPLDLYIRIVK